MSESIDTISKTDKFFRRYSLVLVFPSNLGEDLVQGKLDNIKNFLEEYGIFESAENHGLKTLAQPIAKNTAAFYIQIYFKLEEGQDLGKICKDIKFKLKVTYKEVIRYLLQRVYHEEKSTSLGEFKGFNNLMQQSAKII
jgi:ribosomal protein S6